MKALDRREAPAIRGEAAPPSLLWGLVAAGTLSMAMALRLWSIAEPAATVSPKAASPAAEAGGPAAAPPPGPAADAPVRPDSSIGGAADQAAIDCPPVFSVAFGMGSDVPEIDSAALHGLVRWMLAHPQAMLVIDGHADAAGTAAANFTLSQRRAQAVAARLGAARLPAERITQRAFGFYAPLSGAPHGSPRNRRVDLSVKGATACPTGESP